MHPLRASLKDLPGIPMDAVVRFSTSLGKRARLR